jgi:hypothetical protein
MAVAALGIDHPAVDVRVRADKRSQALGNLDEPNRHREGVLRVSARRVSSEDGD